MPTKSKLNKTPPKNQAPHQTPNLTFLGHLKELRQRILIVVGAISIGAAVTYSFNSQVTAWLLKPANGQHFIFTTPGGGIDFLLRLCLYGGLLVSIPVLIYQVLRFMQPLIGVGTLKIVQQGALAATVLTGAGIAFGYFIGLPAAMHFLLQGFSNDQISALITIQSYLSFVLIYLIGCALLFQVPLVLVIINHIRPLKPKKLFVSQRWFIVGALVIGAIINPSPNIQDQLLLSIPMIIMYQLGIALIWLINRQKKRKKVLATDSAYDLQ